MNTVASVLASLIDARSNCIRDTARGANPHLVEWIDKHKARANEIARECLPSGAGIDSGTRIDWARSTGQRLVLVAPYHHMDESGYTGWTDHTITVEASLIHGLRIRVSGRDLNGIKDYLADTFDSALRAECEL